MLAGNLMDLRVTSATCMDLKKTKKAYEELSYYTFTHKDSSFIHQHIVDAFAAQNADNDTKPITIVFARSAFTYVEKNYSGEDIQKKHIGASKKTKTMASDQTA